MTEDEQTIGDFLDWLKDVKFYCVAQEWSSWGEGGYDEGMSEVYDDYSELVKDYLKYRDGTPTEEGSPYSPPFKVSPYRPRLGFDHR